MLQLQRMFISYCRLFSGRYNRIRLIAVLIVLTVLVTAVLFYIFVNEDVAGSVPPAAHVRYRHKFQELAAGIALRAEHAVSANLSSRLQAGGIYPPHGDSKLELYHNVRDPLAIPRNAEYCNLPVKNVTGEEGEVPRGYRLVSVQVMIRHGTRSPMYSFPNHHNPQLSCQFDRAAKSKTLLASFIRAMKFNEKRVNPKNPFFNWLLYPQRKVCGVSELMPAGTVQHLLNGFHLHDKYVRKSGLFSDSFHGEQVHVMTTLYSRTYQSAIALLYGLLPRFDLSELSIQHSSHMFCDDRFMHSSCVCPALQKLKELVNVEALQFNKNNTRLLALQKYIGEVFGLKTNQLPVMWSMADIFMGYACNKVKALPCNSKGKCIKPWVMAELWDLVDEYGNKLNHLKSFQHLTQVTMYPFLVKVLEQMNLNIKNRTKVKFSLFSGHDTTLTPLAVALGIGNGKWPSLASRIVFELYSEKDQKDRHYIKVLYNGKNATPDLNFCQGHVVSGLCKLKHFSRFVKEEILQGQTYAHVCHVKM